MRAFGPITVVAGLLALIMVPLIIFSAQWVYVKLVLAAICAAAFFAATMMFTNKHGRFGWGFVLVGILYNPFVIFTLAGAGAIIAAVCTAILFFVAAFLFKGPPPEDHTDELPERLF